MSILNNQIELTEVEQYALDIIERLNFPKAGFSSTGEDGILSEFRRYRLDCTEDRIRFALHGLLELALVDLDVDGGGRFHYSITEYGRKNVIGKLPAQRESRVHLFALVPNREEYLREMRHKE